MIGCPLGVHYTARIQTSDTPDLSGTSVFYNLFHLSTLRALRGGQLLLITPLQW